MKNIKPLWSIFLTLNFVLVLLGCSLVETQSISNDFNLEAVSVPEGIRLSFDNIPSNIKRIFVHCDDWGGKDNLDNWYDGTSIFAAIQEPSLIEQLKETKTIILPFVQAGHKYKITTVFLFHNNELLTGENIPKFIETECIADAGIYFDKNIELNLNTQTSVTLSAKPQFSSEVQFAAAELNYKLILLYSKNKAGFATISIWDKFTRNNISVDGLTWIYEPEMADYLKEGNQIKNGVIYPAYFSAHCNVIYDNITWSIEIAKSCEFGYSY